MIAFSSSINGEVYFNKHNISVWRIEQKIFQDGRFFVLNWEILAGAKPHIPI